jgi:hypothetical protein
LIDKKTTQVQFKARRIRKEAIPMEEKAVGKGMFNNPLKFACIGLEEGRKESQGQRERRVACTCSSRSSGCPTTYCSCECHL